MDEEHLLHDLLEAFADPMFDQNDLLSVEIRELVQSNPALARSIQGLYVAYRESRKRAENLAFHMAEDDADPDSTSAAHPVEPLDEISTLIQRHQNYFPELEEGADALVQSVGLDPQDTGAGLIEYLRSEHGYEVEILKDSDMAGAIRRFQPRRRRLQLSEVSTEKKVSVTKKTVTKKASPKPS